MQFNALVGSTWVWWAMSRRNESLELALDSWDGADPPEGDPCRNPR